MRRIIKSKMIKNFIFLTIFLISIECIFMLLSDLDIFKISNLRIIISIISYSIILSLILSFINKKVRFALNIIFVLGCSLYALIQLSFIDYIGVYASFNNASQLSAVNSFVGDFIASIDKVYYVLFIPVVISIVTYIIFLYRSEKKIKEIKRNTYIKESLIKIVLSIFLIILLNIIYYKTLTHEIFKDKHEINNLVDLYEYPDDINSAIDNFGVLTYGLRDLRTKIFDIPKKINLDIIGENTTNDNFDEEYWNELISNEDDEIYNLIHNYLKNNSSTSNNDYTNILDGKNVIFVLMESVNEVILNEEYYPNFNILLENGIYFENNYAPRNNCSTGNNEFAALTSLYVMTNNCTVNEYVSNIYPYSLFNLFEDDGYSTTAMHNYNDTFYQRHISMLNLGANVYYGIEELEIEYVNNYIDWVSDEEFATTAMDLIDFESEDPFMLWLTTVTAHSPYDESSKFGDLYYDLFGETDYSDEAKRYLSKVKVTDDMLGVLLNTLEGNNVLDDTVIIALSDHYPYGLSDDDINMLIGSENIDNNYDKVPFVIYNSEIESLKVSEHTTYMNVLPTVSNLFGLNYKSEFYFGTDALDDDYDSLSVFTDGSWKNEHAFYNSVISEITYYGSYKYTEEEIKNINLNISNDKEVSSLILEYDYYNYIHSKEQMN